MEVPPSVEPPSGGDDSPGSRVPPDDATRQGARPCRCGPRHGRQADIQVEFVPRTRSPTDECHHSGSIEPAEPSWGRISNFHTDAPTVNGALASPGAGRWTGAPRSPAARCGCPRWATPPQEADTARHQARRREADGHSASPRGGVPRDSPAPPPRVARCTPSGNGDRPHPADPRGVARRVSPDASTPGGAGCG